MTRARDIADLAGGGTLLTRQLFTATAGQTTFTPSAGYNPGALEVFMNGLMLLASDYTATNSSTVVLGVAANAGDEVEILTYQINTIGDTVSASNGGTFNSSVLVGKSVDTLATSGTVLFANGQVDASVDSNYVAKFNRKSSDGTIIELRKDTTNIVGSIGVQSTDQLYIATPDGSGVGLIFDGDNRKIDPTDGVGSNIDDAVDLGTGAYRFKDLYLSGGVYLGGTGAANKLDDYEEGTWTPTITNSGFTNSASSLTATYTKVGNTVHFELNIVFANATTVSSHVYISGFPFVSAGSGDSFARQACGIYNCDDPATGAGYDVGFIRAGQVSGQITLYKGINPASDTKWLARGSVRVT
jgi:hypothetical protein